SRMSLITALIILGVPALICGIILGFAAVRFHVASDPIVEQIDALLPQPPCGQCGYPCCPPYAAPTGNGEEIQKCAPGGETTIKNLSELLGVEAKPLDAAHGAESVKKVAVIREDECIGCTKCIQACPVDAILGAAKHMHTVIAHECT